jgi:hypothetical protein
MLFSALPSFENLPELSRKSTPEVLKTKKWRIQATGKKLIFSDR